MGGREKIATLTLAERLQAAKSKTASVVDHLLYLLELHENNALVLYSPLLSSQIPHSHAANAFNVFQRGMHQIELVRLCALWDSVETEKENVPTIIELINRSDVVDALAEETSAQWKGLGGHIANLPDDPDLRALTIEALRQSNEEFGVQQATKARACLHRAIDQVGVVLASPRLQSIMNLRDKHLAHSLSETRREKKIGPIPPMKYGDERAILDLTLPIVETLYCWVNGCSFSFEQSREIDQRNAKALWKNCTFKIDD